MKRKNIIIIIITSVLAICSCSGIHKDAKHAAKLQCEWFELIELLNTDLDDQERDDLKKRIEQIEYEISELESKVQKKYKNNTEDLSEFIKLFDYEFQKCGGIENN